MVAENLAEVHKRIQRACERSGRRPQEVVLVAVSKTFGKELIGEALGAGQLDFGENYVQELSEKRKEFSASNARWHFIGHLQSNKAKYLVEFIHLVHSVDNEHVAKELNRRAEGIQRVTNVLLEVHTTDEATKFGVPPQETLNLAKSVALLPWVRIQGLMTMGPFSENPDDSRPSFCQLRELKHRIESEGIEHVEMRHLSMGMSHDFEVAVEEGATIVRVGTAIFGKRTKALTG